MASNEITYQDKVKVKESGLPDINTVKADNLNEIKDKHNSLANNVLQKDNTD